MSLLDLGEFSTEKDVNIATSMDIAAQINTGIHALHVGRTENLYHRFLRSTADEKAEEYLAQISTASL
jgi:hypothetical protein